jgi:hypothetical protein
MFLKRRAEGWVGTKDKDLEVTGFLSGLFCVRPVNMNDLRWCGKRKPIHKFTF